MGESVRNRNQVSFCTTRRAFSTVTQIQTWYWMCFRLKTMICSNRISTSIKRALNKWLLWQKSSDIRESRKKMAKKRRVRRYYCNHEHPKRCRETVWKHRGFEVIEEFNVYSLYQKEIVWMFFTRKKSKELWLIENIYFWKNPGMFRLVTSPLEIPQNCVSPFGCSIAKAQDQWKFRMIFSWLSLEIALLFK